MKVADIFRAHGAAWGAANKGHVSLGQLRVISAIKAPAVGVCRAVVMAGIHKLSQDLTHAAQQIACAAPIIRLPEKQSMFFSLDEL